MKVLHIISQTPDFTGSGKYVLEMIDQSKKQGHENFLVAGTASNYSLPAHVLSPEHCRFIRFGQDLAFPIVGMSDVMPYSSTVCSHLTPEQIELYKAAFRREIRHVVEQFSPDIIHTNHLWMASAVTREAAPDIPMVTTCHGTCLRQHQLCPELGKSLIDSLSKIDRVIALFQDQKVEIQKLLGLNASKVDIISGGFNQNNFYFEKKQTSPQTVQILYAGKINVSKGVPWLLKSLGKISNERFHLHLVGGGSGSEMQSCLELAESLGDKVTVHGILSHEKLGALMRESHLFVMPSFFEGLPLVLLEAMACGCRIITTDLPGCKQLFHHRHRTMVRMVELPELMTIDQPYSEDEVVLEDMLSSLIVQVIKEVQQGSEPDMEYIHFITEPYTWEKIFAKVERVYQNAVTENKSFAL
ncbi:glycosyltransferase family 4 protein [Maridesulfovibrio frigidus]|uniref:glycosyltransferase family 4 protein n=1 Tax=Maridesulfovibrio frigidus TaxID=340956 RepID=UPI0004E280A3|nr:glycosyltransferase family 4 protein [Maridesulfovibrio frigidus]